MEEDKGWVRVYCSPFLNIVGEAQALAIKAVQRLIATGASEDEVLEELLRVELTSSLILHSRLPEWAKVRGRDLHTELIANTPADLIEQVKNNSTLTAMLKAIPDALIGMCQ